MNFQNQLIIYDDPAKMSANDFVMKLTKVRSGERGITLRLSMLKLWYTQRCFLLVSTTLFPITALALVTDELDVRVEIDGTTATLKLLLNTVWCYYVDEHHKK